VRHSYARFEPWQIGRVQDDSGFHEALDFDEAHWNVESIKQRFRTAGRSDEPSELLTDTFRSPMRKGATVLDESLGR